MLGGDNMQTYSNKDDLIFEISKRAELLLMNLVMYQNQIRMYIKLVSIEHTAQMIAYQLGWLNLIQSWENDNKNNIPVVTPSTDYKWNNLGGLYQEFYKTYSNYTLEQLINQFNKEVDSIIELIKSLDNETLFESGKGNGLHQRLPNGQFGNGFTLTP